MSESVISPVTACPLPPSLLLQWPSPLPIPGPTKQKRRGAIDLESLLDFKPAEPTIIMMHDMGNPECRSGAVSVDWSRSPYTHYVDLDFVPGRIVEHAGSGSGEVWGGLGLALLLPHCRTSELTVGRTFQRSLDALWRLV